MADDRLTAQQAAALLGVYRDRVPALARLVDLGERDSVGRWWFRPQAIEALRGTGLVKPTGRQGQHGARPAGMR